MQSSARPALPPVAYKLLILTAALAWGGSFVVLKDAIAAVPTSWLLAMRFALAAAVLSLVCRRRIAANLDRSTLAVGALIGTINGCGYLIQNIGLETTTPGRSAFISSIYCVLVPFFYWAFAKRRPALHNVAAAVICVAGLGFLSLGDGMELALGFGDVLTLVSAGFFAAEIAAYACLATKQDPIALTAVQFVAYAVVCAAYGLAADPFPAASSFTPAFWGQMCYLVLASSCVATVAQNVGQKHVPPAQAALLLSFESVFGVALSLLFGYEHLTPALFVGFALIFAGMLVSELMPSPEARLLEDEVASAPDGR